MSFANNFSQYVPSHFLKGFYFYFYLQRKKLSFDNIEHINY